MVMFQILFNYNKIVIFSKWFSSPEPTYDETSNPSTNIILIQFLKLILIIILECHNGTCWGQSYKSFLLLYTNFQTHLKNWDKRALAVSG